MTFRFAIIGAGVISSGHAEALRSFPDQAELAAVVDLDRDRAQSMAERYGAKAFGDIETAVGATGANVAAVCTPTGLHGDAAVRALEAGAHRQARPTRRLTGVSAVGGTSAGRTRCPRDRA